MVLFFGYMTKREIVRLHSTSIFKFLRNIQPDLHITVLTFPPCIVSKESSHHILSIILRFFDDSHSDWGQVASQSSFIWIYLMPRNIEHLITTQSFVVLSLFLSLSLLKMKTTTKNSIHFMCQFSDWQFSFPGS